MKRIAWIGSVLLATTLPAQVIAGKVVDAAGEPAEGATDAPAMPGSFSPVLPFTEVLTDRPGRFRARLPEGSYDMAVDAVNHFPHLTTVKVTGQDEPLELRLPRGEVISGSVIDADELPLANIPVRFRYHWHRLGRFGISQSTAISGEGGRFSLAGLPADLRLRVSGFLYRDGKGYVANRARDVEPGTTDLEIMFTTTVPQAEQRKH